MFGYKRRGETEERESGLQDVEALTMREDCPRLPQAQAGLGSMIR